MCQGNCRECGRPLDAAYGGFCPWCAAHEDVEACAIMADLQDAEGPLEEAVPMSHGKAAFTLIETLVTAGAIATLVGIIAVPLSRARATAREARCKADLSQLVQVTVNYSDDYHALPPTPAPFPDGRLMELDVPDPVWICADDSFRSMHKSSYGYWAPLFDYDNGQRESVPQYRPWMRLRMYELNPTLPLYFEFAQSHRNAYGAHANRISFDGVIYHIEP